MRQAVTKQPAPAPRAPAVPTTSQEMNALVFRAGQIREQLADLTARRAELFQQRLLMKSAERAGHDARIAEIDARSTALEKELFATEDAIGRAETGKVKLTDRDAGTLQDPGGLTQRDMQRAVGNAVRGSVFGTGFTILAIFMVWRGARRFIWRRTPAPAFPDVSPQIVQLQQSIDVIALEVERISEGQRYVAKVLGDRAVGPGAAQPVAVPKGEQAMARERR